MWRREYKNNSDFLKLCFFTDSIKKIVSYPIKKAAGFPLPQVYTSAEYLSAAAAVVAATSAVVAAAAIAVAGNKNDYQENDPSTAVVTKCVTHNMCLPLI